MTFRLQIAFAVAALLGCVTRPSAAQSGATSGLAPGDEIRITVWKQADLSGDFPIAANGTILHPLYREIQVTGVPISTVEERIRTFLQKYQTNPQFVIQPLIRVIVGGEVRTPNVYSVAPETTIAQAIALAGGTTERANLRDIRVVRDRQEVRMDLTQADSDAAVLQVRSGDEVLVGRKRRAVIDIIAPVTSSIAAIAAVTSILLR